MENVNSYKPVPELKEGSCEGCIFRLDYQISCLSSNYVSLIDGLDELHGGCKQNHFIYVEADPDDAGNEAVSEGVSKCDEGSKSLVGKKYIPYDNSWGVNVTRCGNGNVECSVQDRLAGQYKKRAVVCTIVSEPFNCNVGGVVTDPIVKEMIMVEYNNNTHMVLFDPIYISY